jgi:hypothetical protein
MLSTSLGSKCKYPSYQYNTFTVVNSKNLKMAKHMVTATRVRLSCSILAFSSACVVALVLTGREVSPPRSSSLANTNVKALACVAIKVKSSSSSPKSARGIQSHSTLQLVSFFSLLHLFPNLHSTFRIVGEDSSFPVPISNNVCICLSNLMSDPMAPSRPIKYWCGQGLFNPGLD